MPFIRSVFIRLTSAASAWRIAAARLAGAEIGPHCRIGAGCEVAPGAPPARLGRIELGAGTTLERGVVLHPYGGAIVVGTDVFLGPGSVVYGHGGVMIGSHTLISMHCRILSSNHTIPPPGTDIHSQPDVRLPTRIGRDVWLGAGVTVLGGVTIGDGCIVGAGAVVTGDLPPQSIATGIPARVRRSRQ